MKDTQVLQLPAGFGGHESPRANNYKTRIVNVIHCGQPIKTYLYSLTLILTPLIFALISRGLS